ncbi:acyloxyacyl hydrolase [Acidobacteria bacterium AH-259-O06]|nr:acyloxyacyl hydrolase [Acidobacteria bacterium AH-259-G07]MDA2930175.1 acyloxyacyl hydrolase [Acidobacteria bacterium AH-259-O06]
MLTRLQTPLILVAVVGLSLQVTIAQKGFDTNSQSRGLLWGWGHSWKHGWPGYGKTRTDLAFLAFHPQMGWFVADRLELYGEATLLLYHEPHLEISSGLVGMAGRYHFRNDRRWVPYVTLGAGLLWTSLDVLEIDRVFNFQVLYGGGIRFIPEKGPGWIFELRNHHISNAGTAGENIGINAGTILIGIDWILR